MLSIAKLKIEKENLSSYTNFIVADAENPPIQNNSFGACILCSTLHHLTSPKNTIINSSKKLVQGGLFYTIDPHTSTLRFLFDYFMKFWKLYDEEASENPLIDEKNLEKWLYDANIDSVIYFSTYLPPHFFLLLNEDWGIFILKHSDNFFNQIPIFFKISGIVISQGIKK